MLSSSLIDRPTEHTGMDSPSLSFPGGLAVLTGVGLFAWLLNKKTKQRLPFPPGPKPLPIIGNLLDMPREKEWLVYEQWAQKHGEKCSAGDVKPPHRFIKYQGMLFTLRCLVDISLF